MNQRALFQATIERQPRDAFLFYAKFTPDLQQRVATDQGLDPEADLAEHFGMFNPSAVNPQPTATVPPERFRGYYEDIDMPAAAYLDGNGVLHLPGSMYHFTHYVAPLRHARSLADLEAFPFPAATVDDTAMQAAVAAAHHRGRAAVTWVGHMYEDAWQVRDYESFLMDMLTQPEWAEYILDRFTERNLARAVAAARAGVDYITTGDDVANQNALMFSRDHWRRFMKPRWAKVYAAARAVKPDLQIWYHSDGNISDIIGDLVDIGVTILNPVQPECLDPFAVYASYGPHLCLDGMIGTQTTMPFGAPDDVRTAVNRVIDTLGPTGGFILSPTHVLEPEVPLANIYAFFDAVKARAGR